MVVCLFCHCLTHTIDQNILITRLRSTVGCSGRVLDWFIAYLSCFQSVFVGHESTRSVLNYGVSHGSVLGPLLFTLYTHPLSAVICQFGLSNHFFAGDSQLHKSSVPSDFPIIACCLKDCIEDVVEWMGDSKLKMNDDKTELMAISTRSKLSQVIPNLAYMSISGCDIPFFQSLTNLFFFYLDETLSWIHILIKYLCRTLLGQLRRMGKFRSFLSTDAASNLAVSLILSRSDNCNSLLAGITDNKLNKLQHIQNHAARLGLHKSRHASASGLLRTLHWLLVKARSQYKIPCLRFQYIYQNTRPPYISDLLHPYCPSRTLRSFDTSFLIVLRFSLVTFGKRAFSVFGPTVWNSLPLSLRKTQCFTTF